MAAKRKVNSKEEQFNNPTADKSTTVSAHGVPAGLKVVRHVTLASLSIKTPGDARTLIIQTPIRESKIKNQREGFKSANVCNVIDVDTGALCNYIVSAVVKENLEEQYADEGYVGKCFYIENLGMKEGKRYNNFSVTEVEAPKKGK